MFGFCLRKPSFITKGLRLLAVKTEMVIMVMLTMREREREKTLRTSESKKRRRQSRPEKAQDLKNTSTSNKG